MIYFRINGDVMEKYNVTYDPEELTNLQIQIAIKCGEKRIRKEELTLDKIPKNNFFNLESDGRYHYYNDVKFKQTEKTVSLWDDGAEYQELLYECTFTDYICPEIINFIYQIRFHNLSVIERLFNNNVANLRYNHTVNSQISELQSIIKNMSIENTTNKRLIFDGYNRSCNELIESGLDIVEISAKEYELSEKVVKDITKLDKEYSKQYKFFSTELEYYLGIQELNINQEEVSKYVDELYKVVKFVLIDSMRLDEIQRVNYFLSKDKPMKLERLLD